MLETRHDIIRTWGGHAHVRGRAYQCASQYKAVLAGQVERAWHQQKGHPCHPQLSRKRPPASPGGQACLPALNPFHRMHSWKTRVRSQCGPQRMLHLPAQAGLSVRCIRPSARGSARHARLACAPHALMGY